MKCKLIKKLNDISLTTGIYYLELIRCIMPNVININLINYHVPTLSSSIKKDFNLHDKYYKKRKQNLKYCMTIIRRFGVDLFINVDDLFRLESRAVVSILAALMTISLSQEKLKQKEDKNDDANEEEEEQKDIDIDILYNDDADNNSVTASPQTQITLSPQVTPSPQVSPSPKAQQNSPSSTVTPPKNLSPIKSNESNKKKKSKKNNKKGGKSKGKGKGKAKKKQNKPD